MYIFTGLLGAMAPILGAVALHRRASLKPCFWTFQLSLLSIVATLGLSIYMLEKSSELGMVWW